MGNSIVAANGQVDNGRKEVNKMNSWQMRGKRKDVDFSLFSDSNDVSACLFRFFIFHLRQSFSFVC